MGKSALLKAVGERARERGATVVTTTCTQSEARLAFGGLHQLLLPFLDRVDHRPDPQRKALNVAFGVSEGDAPDVFLAIGASIAVSPDDRFLAISGGMETQLYDLETGRTLRN